MKIRNVIGQQVGYLRNKLKWTQDRLADRLQLAGWHDAMYRLIQRQKLKTCRVLRGKLLVPRTELLQLLQTELR